MRDNLVKLDKLERRLLQALDENARQSYVELSKKLSTPPETIRYRLKALVERGVIFQFLTVIHTGKVGNEYYKVLLKFHNVNEEILQSIINDLVQNNDVNWVARLDGRFDIAFTIRVQRIFELSNFLDQFKIKYKEYLHRLIFAVNIQVEYLVRNYLTGKKKRKGRPAYYESSPSDPTIDKTDRRILKLLANQARNPATHIAKEIGLSSETINQRIKQMEGRGVIVRYRTVLDNSILDQDNYYILVYLNYVSEQRLTEFINYCRQHPNIVYFIKALGEWDYELNIEVNNLDDYRSLMMDLTLHFSDLIKDYLGLPVSKIYKFTLTP